MLSIIDCLLKVYTIKAKGFDTVIYAYAPVCFCKVVQQHN